MVTQIKTISSNTFYPYFNLALEKYLFDTVDDRTVILYLWQNDKTVVYGSNQNVWKEVQVSKLIDDGGFPVRRLSGGGAVFHDKGNLNFTFLTKKDNYNVDRQLKVLMEACRLLGLTVEKTGRGDLTIEGRKFSDSAFYRAGERCCHHGTLLINTDISMMSRYLNADRSRPESNGASSMESGVADLADFCPSLDAETMRVKLFEAFEQVYGLKPVPMSGQELEPAVIGSYEKIFSDDNWLFGHRIKYKDQICRRFDWGEFDLNLNVDKGTITTAQLYSDADDEHFIASIGEKLEGTACSREALTELVRSCCTSPEHNAMAEDICRLLFETI